MSSSHNHACQPHGSSSTLLGAQSEPPGSYDTVNRNNNNNKVRQDIPGRYISPHRLKRQLRLKFGENNYTVYMMHNAYHITAGRELSEDEIDWCRL